MRLIPRLAIFLFCFIVSELSARAGEETPLSAAGPKSLQHEIEETFRSIDHRQSYGGLAFHPRGRSLAATQGTAGVRWDLATRKVVDRQEFQSRPMA